MNKSRFNFLKRHLGPNDTDIDLMLKSLSVETIDNLIKKVIPPNIYSKINEDLFRQLFFFSLSAIGMGIVISGVSSLN